MPKKPHAIFASRSDVAVPRSTLSMNDGERRETIARNSLANRQNMAGARHSGWALLNSLSVVAAWYPPNLKVRRKNSSSGMHAKAPRHASSASMMLSGPMTDRIGNTCL
ncbi:MAG: hypothetical protein NTY65_05425, partial [Planctomycetota bacterium]|nr:hypothetical protein [Planctomycetota bacterium]